MCINTSWFPANFLHWIQEIKKKIALPFELCTFSENDKLLNHYYALEIVLNTLFYFLV